MLNHLKAVARTAIFLAAASLASVAFVPGAGAQQGAATITINPQATKHAGEFVVPINKSQILRMDVPFTDLSVGNPRIADVLPLTNRTIYVLGKALGSTNLAIYGRNKALIAVVDLVVSHDIEGLKRSLFEHLPGEKIGVRATGNSLSLSGTISNADRLQQALSIAERYAPGAVTNLLQVKGSQQVLLEVRIAEMRRDVTKQLGFNTRFTFDDGTTALGLNSVPGVSFLEGTEITGPFIGGPLFSPGSGNFVGGITSTLGQFGLQILFDALERKNLSKTLAEPNLVAMSGETARFLAGGEFPVPVAQQTDRITIEFKEFGVGLAFTPTVLGDGLINLVIAPEISSIDQRLNVGIGDVNVFGLATKRARTTVELRDGQSFAIAGLLQSDFRDNITQFPWLGDVPILGNLFRSTDFRKDETELVILVTPHLVKPAPAGSLAAPTDRFVPPNDKDLFLDGMLERPAVSAKAGGGAKSAASSSSKGGAGGMAGKYGHILK